MSEDKDNKSVEDGKLFDTLYNMNDSEVAESRRDIARAKVERGFASAISSLEESMLDVKDNISTLRIKIVGGDYDKIRALAEAKLELKELEMLIVSMKEEADLFI